MFELNSFLKIQVFKTEIALSTDWNTQRKETYLGCYPVTETEAEIKINTHISAFIKLWLPKRAFFKTEVE